MLKRIYNKGLSILNSAIGKLHLLLERKGFVKPVPFQLYKQLDNKVTVDLAYPVNFDKSDKQLFDHYTHYPTHFEAVFELKNINLSRSGLVFKGFNNLAQALPHPIFREQYGWLYMLGQYLFHKKIKASSSRTLILVYDFWAIGNYYHWLVDSLPRLWTLRDELKSENYSLVLPEGCPKFITASLKYFDIAHITYIPKHAFLSVYRLLIPDYSVGSGRIHPLRVQEVKQFLSGKVTTVKEGGRIYVSRSRQKARKLINEEDVVAVVKQAGFKVVYFEDHTVEEQIAIAKSASILVSSHGANMTNLMFMPPGAKVLELIRRNNPNFCYWALASVTQVNYYYQLCTVEGNDHLRVNVDLFKVNLQRLLHE